MIVSDLASVQEPSGRHGIWYRMRNCYEPTSELNTHWLASQADYKDIDPLYGKLEDVDELIRELKKRDMKLMMDLVVNHTSDQVSVC